MTAEQKRKWASWSVSSQPASVRPMEVVWILLTFVLLAAYLEKSDVSAQVIAERAKLIPTCERNTRVAVAALNGWQIQEGDVRVACKRLP